MAEIDPIILELQANLDRYRADLRQITSEVTSRLGSQESAVKSLEDQFRRSSSEIGGSLRGLAGAIAAAFSAQQIKEYIDSYTRLQNSLKVSGLEGQKLVEVQAELLALSKQYGVSINELADLYGKSSQAAADLGASSQQLLQVTEASAQALKITGTSAAQAGGALLGLTQALSGGIVRAEEFNQINEGGLRPLLQAAANAERFGGSISKLRAAVIDGKFSSHEFYQAILNGSQQLEGQASKAVLTLEGAFTALGSALTVYIGEASESNGATAALSAGILTLSENLDTLANVLGVIAAFMVGRYAGALATVVAGKLAAARAAVVLSAAAAGAGTQMQVLGIRAALTGRALLAAFGGPVGLAVTALTVGLGALAFASEDAAESVDKLTASNDAATDELDAMIGRLKAAGVQTDGLASAADRAAGAVDGLADAYTRALIEARKFNKESGAGGLIETAKSIETSQDRQAELRQKIAGRRQARALGGSNPYGGGGALDSEIETLKRDLSEEVRREALLRVKRDVQIAGIQNGVDVNEDPARPSTPAAGKPKKTPKARGATGPSAADLAARYAQDIANLQLEELQARLNLATDAGERSEIERDMLNIERGQREADIDKQLADKEITLEQANAKRALVRSIYGEAAQYDESGQIILNAKPSLLGLAIAREERLQAEQEAADLAQTEYRVLADSLRNQYDLAQTEDERRAMALRILEAEDAYLRSKLEAVIANQDLTEAVRQQAQIELDALNASSGDRRKIVEKANAGALDRYIQSMSDPKARVEEAAVRQLQAINDGIVDAVTETLGIKNRFIKDLFSIFLDNVIFRPLAEALRDGQSGGGGLFGSLFSSIGSIFGGGGASGGFGGGIGGGFLPGAKNTGFNGGLFDIFKGPNRASGGHVNAGTMYRVNEGAGKGRVEGFLPRVSGHIIPLGNMNAIAARPSARQGPIEIRVFADEGGTFVPRVEAISEGVSVKTTIAYAGPISDLGAQKALSQASRPKM